MVGQERLLEIEAAWSGPMPPPNALAGYEEILPGAADRILRMAEASLHGRVKREDRLVDAGIELRRSGLNYAFLIALACIAASAMFFGIGREWAGTVFLSMPVMLLVRSFLRRQHE